MSLALVHEESTAYIHHDQLFKELIHSFFEEFLEAFFPEVHQHVDFTSIKALSEEMFTDLHEGESRRADIVIETKLKKQDTLIIIHVEPQSYKQSNFHERMYHYFSMLYNKYRKPILPIAIFSYDMHSSERNKYRMAFPFFHVLTFNFLKLELKKMNWRDYLHSDNPVAAALLSKMGYTEDEKVQVKKEFLRMLVRMKIDLAKATLINGFFETYLTLNKMEEAILMKDINQLAKDEPDFIKSLPNSWRDKGLKEGRREGKIEAKKEDAIAMLREGLSIDLIAKITELSKAEIEKLKQK